MGGGTADPLHHGCAPSAGKGSLDQTLLAWLLLPLGTRPADPPQPQTSCRQAP